MQGEEKKNVPVAYRGCHQPISLLLLLATLVSQQMDGIPLYLENSHPGLGCMVPERFVIGEVSGEKAHHFKITHLCLEEKLPWVLWTTIARWYL